MGSDVVRLGVSVPYTGLDAASVVATARHAEALGFDSIWTSEAWGSDAIVPLTWIAAHTERLRLGTAILQVAARTPAMTAMTAATLDMMSGGRLVLGLGVSGPQVVEGWHGEPYGKPLARTREYIEILRAIWAREEKLEYHGEHYDIPYQAEDATGLGLPLRLLLRPRADIPIYVAALGPRNVRLAAEIADGLLPFLWSPSRWEQAFGEALAGADRSTFEIAPLVLVAMGDDVGECRDQIRPRLAFYVGGMGARGRNFYFDVVCRYGYDGAARDIQERFLAGDRGGAVAAVPDALVDDLTLVGPKGRIAEQLQRWQESPVSTLILSTTDPDTMTAIAEAAT
jgi:F420-dependent oxidoreductase-like protein